MRRLACMDVTALNGLGVGAPCGRRGAMSRVASMNVDAPSGRRGPKRRAAGVKSVRRATGVEKAYGTREVWCTVQTVWRVVRTAPRDADVPADLLDTPFCPA